ncbi:MAG: HU family DNA-binding protein [Candidatus Cyclobacteriaceae bacterium M2_1C_046]
MPVSYKIVVKRPGGIGKDCKPKYYPSITKTNMMELSELSDIMSDKAGINRATIYGVAELLANVIPELLQEGHSIKFGNLGIFSLSIKGEGRDSPKEVNATKIREVKINFRPSQVIKRKLRTTNFRKVK